MHSLKKHVRLLTRLYGISLPFRLISACAKYPESTVCTYTYMRNDLMYMLKRHVFERGWYRLINMQSGQQG